MGALFREQKLGMDFVTAKQKVMALGEGPQRFKFLRAIHPPRGVLGIAQKKETGGRGNRRLERVEVHDPFAPVSYQRHFDALPAAVFRGGEEGVVDRGCHHDVIPGRAGAATGEVETRNNAREPDDPARIRDPAIARLKEGEGGLR